MTIRTDLEAAARSIEEAYRAAGSNAEISASLEGMFDDERPAALAAIASNASMIADRIQDARNDLERAFAKAYEMQNVSYGRANPKPAMRTRRPTSTASPRVSPAPKPTPRRTPKPKRAPDLRLITNDEAKIGRLANDERWIKFEESPGSGEQLVRIESVIPAGDGYVIVLETGGTIDLMKDPEGEEWGAIYQDGLRSEPPVDLWLIELHEEIDEDADFFEPGAPRPGPRSPRPGNPPEIGRDVELSLLSWNGPSSIIGKVASVAKSGKTIKIRTRSDDVWTMRWREAEGQYQGKDPYNPTRRYAVRFYPPR